MAIKPIQLLITAKDEASAVFESVRQRIAAIGSIGIGVALGNAITGVINKVRDMGAEFLRVNVEMDAARRGLNAIYKDAGLVERQLGFLKETARDAGVEFSGLLDPYKSFTASASAANIPLQTQNDLFRSVVRAGATLGLSNEKVGSTLMALSQMAGKGVVSMEELRQQLGEALPGALSLVAKGLGLTEQELIKLVESGGLAARDLFPALASSLKDMAGANESAAGYWERLKNAIAQAMTAVGDAGGMQVMTLAVKALSVAVGALLLPLQTAMELFMALAKTVGGALAAIQIMTDGSLTASAKLEALKAIGSDLGDTYAAAGERIGATTKAFRAAAGGADETAGAVGRAATAANTATGSAAALSAAWVATGVTMQKAAAEAGTAATNAAKHAEAVKLQGEVLVSLAKVQGNVVALADAEATAAANNAAALQSVATARAQQLEFLQTELTAKQNLIAGDAEEQKARAQSLKDLTEKIEKLKAEAAASGAAASASLADADAKRRAAAAIKDHSGQIKEFIAVIERQKSVVQALEQLNFRSKATDERLTQAKRELGDSYSLLNDALADNVANQNAAVAAAQTDAATTRTLLEADMERAKVAEQRARQMGDEYGARQAIIKQKEIEIAIVKADIKANEMLAIAKIAALNAEREQLTNAGQLTDAKSQEIEATIRAAEAQVMLSKARGESVGLMEEELRKLRAGITGVGEYERAARSAASATRDAAGGMGRSWDGVAGSIGNASQKAAEYEAFQKRMQDKYGRPGESDGERKAAAERDRKAKEKDDNYMASRFERGLARDTDGNVVGSVESEAQMNQRIAKLFGEGAIGMKEAIEAANIKIKLDEAAKYGVANIPGNNEFYTNLRREFERLSAVVLGSGKAGNGAAIGRSQPPAQDATRDEPRSTSSGGGISAPGAGQVVNQITIDNKTYTVPSTPQGSSDLTDLLRAVGAAKKASVH